MTELAPPKQQAQPHELGWFTTLLSMFSRTEHPAAADDDALIDMMDGDPSSMMDLFNVGADRQKKLQTFEEMDAHGLVASILDLYAEETTQPDYDKQKRVWIESSSKPMISAGEACLANIQIEERVTAIARRIAKYGDDFRRLIYAAGQGVLGWRAAKPADMTRIEDQYARLVGFKENAAKYRQQSRDVSWPWDYVHFRNLGKDPDDLYGTSMLEAMFRPWRQLALTEDAMLMFRLRRGPDRNAFMVNIGTMDSTESAQWMNTFKNKFRKAVFVDPASPNYRKQYDPLTPLEDVFLPVRDPDSVRIEPISGGGSTIADTYDLEYFRDAFFGSARVPKAYLGFEGEINAKATLIMQDVRFARGCKRLRTSTILGIRNTLDIHYTLSATAEDRDKYSLLKPENAYVVQMSPITYLDEFERLELVKLRFEIVEAQMRIAQDLQLDVRVWAAYILLNYAKLPEDLVVRLLTKIDQRPPQPQDAEQLEAQLTAKQLEVWNLLPKAKRAEILGSSKAPKVVGALTEAQAQQCAQMVHRMPGLRRIIGEIAFFHMDPDDFMLRAMQERQRDQSMMPPVCADGSVLKSELSDDSNVLQLAEDLKKLKPATKEAAGAT